MQHFFFLQHQTLLSPPDTSITECCFDFGPGALFFLELLVIAFRFSPVAYWTPSELEDSLLVSYLFAFSYCSWGSPVKNIVVGCHFFLQWTTVLSELFIMIHLSWVALHIMAHNFTELYKSLHHNKAVMHQSEWSRSVVSDSLQPDGL